MSSLVSANVGRPQVLSTGRRLLRTAIWKTPVEGRVAVRGVNLDGDDQADRRVHGGEDKAVYAYASEESAWWAAELGREVEPGALGENLTTAGLDVSGAVVGERWTVGTTELEVVQPRLPCFKLGVRFGDPAMVRRFAQASRPGAYLRVVREGELGAGDAVTVTHRPDHGVTMALMSDAMLVDHALFAQVVRAPGLIDDWVGWAAEHGFGPAAPLA